MPTLEEFATQLNQELDKQCGHAGAYVFVGKLRRAIAEAMRGPEEQSNRYPLAMFRDKGWVEVKSAAEEAAAQADGFGYAPPPRYEEGYPKYFIERPRICGGTKVWDLRRVQLNSSAGLAQFLAVVEVEEWMQEDVQSLYGPRGIGLQELVEERRTLLRQIIDTEQLTITEAEVDEFTAKPEPAATSGDVTQEAAPAPNDVAPAIPSPIAGAEEVS